MALWYSLDCTPSNNQTYTIFDSCVLYLQAVLLFEHLKAEREWQIIKSAKQDFHRDETKKIPSPAGCLLLAGAVLVDGSFQMQKLCHRGAHTLRLIP